ncbi:hypothetical protein P280DRAFT_404355 [Massarina eburnea CBS 473.64]|uniref:Uncharacterized protein n=1 Tax=Massarina eburnea CBS 473.64 TaxID=1395130 RepID=A0A6A6RU60_9PLEO|nr:hypothetical protein P280DRAFT_404355 [Massarina eburnea CBS 473.64]
MTDRVAKPRPRKKREPKAANNAPNGVRKVNSVQPVIPKQEVLSPVPERAATPTALQLVPQHRKPGAGQWIEDEANGAIATIRHQYTLPSMYQPSHIVPEALDLAFITHFVQLNQGVRSYNPEIPWITHLPNLRQNANNPALRLSIRAASMAFYATVHRDTTVLVDSYRWYTLSLNSQRNSLYRLGPNSIPSNEDILVPVILSLYEVFAGTTTTSIWQHLGAAVKIIAMRGPKKCKGSSFALFKAMRVSDAHVCMIFNTPSVLASHDWMTIPFENASRNAHHQLADILLQIPPCISQCGIEPGSMRKFFAEPIPPGIDLRPVEQCTRELLQDIENWALRFPSLTYTGSGEQIVAATDTELDVNGCKPANSDRSYIILPDSFVALTASTYEAIRVILYLLLDKVSVDWSISPAFSGTSPASSLSYTSSLVDNAIIASQAVLKNSSYMESTHPVGFDFMRSVFPVVVVATLAPRLHEQQEAEEMLNRWGRSRGMAGLCAAWLNV